MARRGYDTVQDVLFWSYANLAMAHSALRQGALRYSTPNYVVRAKLFRGLTDGSMSVGSIYDDEREKHLSSRCCTYCGAAGAITLDHIFARSLGGPDTGDNLVGACRRCNSSKGHKDLLVWHRERGKFPPLGVLRRYLKMSITYATRENLLPVGRTDWPTLTVPFDIEAIPLTYPSPDQLRWSFETP